MSLFSVDAVYSSLRSVELYWSTIGIEDEAFPCILNFLASCPNLQHLTFFGTLWTIPSEFHAQRVIKNVRSSGMFSNLKTFRGDMESIRLFCPNTVEDLVINGHAFERTSWDTDLELFGIMGQPPQYPKILTSASGPFVNITRLIIVGMTRDLSCFTLYESAFPNLEILSGLQLNLPYGVVNTDIRYEFPKLHTLIVKLDSLWLQQHCIDTYRGTLEIGGAAMIDYASHELKLQFPSLRIFKAVAYDSVLMRYTFAQIDVAFEKLVNPVDLSFFSSGRTFHEMLTMEGSKPVVEQALGLGNVLMERDLENVYAREAIYPDRQANASEFRSHPFNRRRMY
ncbi:hypothetical protein SISNIDRAFT_250554 [Sistotremastrum niveocremeum HHB9708]|uniref:Uncharacterized protein n=1 Tax=Sistotremastrum niveocremeum HHB9708 TaxID=1314777 RepID=A0A164YXQ6_9AGAM|nr:hypothetical protein SISNIDRAFT_250554 [Sistotremastrum niveocremeum HHB9708]